MKKYKTQKEIGLAIVSSYGLKFKGVIYTNTHMIKHRWFELARIHGEWEIPILYDPNERSEVMLLHLTSIDLASAVIQPEVNADMKQLYHDALNALKEQLNNQRLNHE